MRLRAFTMIEILTGLLIGSIVILLAVISIYQLEKLHVDFRARTNAASNKSRLYDLIYSDIQQAVSIHSSEMNDGFYTIYEKSNSSNQELLRDSIYYKFEEERLRRIQGEREDTFCLDVEMPNMENTVLNKGLITKITIETTGEPWIFIKEYPAAVLLDRRLNQPDEWP